LKSYVVMTAAVVALLATPVVVRAENIVRGAHEGSHQGAHVGHRVLGPVGGFVGGVVGGVTGGVVGGVEGALGVRHHRHRYYYRRY
jgi:hypothetical protein